MADNDDEDDETSFRRAAITCAILFVVPSAIYFATHSYHPSDSPGGFGEGYRNMLDGVLYGIIIVPAFFGMLICTIGWIAAIVRKGK